MSTQSVSFASATEVISTNQEHQEQERQREGNSWYSRVECRQFMRLAVADAIRLRQVLNNVSAGGGLDQNDLYLCIGIERFLSQRLFQETVQNRQALVAAVVARQNDFDIQGLRGFRGASPVRVK